jgi:hypothetical protein
MQEQGRVSAELEKKTVTLVIPTDLNADINDFAKKFGMSRNGLMRQCVKLRGLIGDLQFHSKATGGGTNVSVGKMALNGRELDKYDHSQTDRVQLQVPLRENSSLLNSALHAEESSNHYVNRSLAFAVALFAAVEKQGMSPVSGMDITIGDKTLGFYI